MVLSALSMRISEGRNFAHLFGFETNFFETIHCGDSGFVFVNGLNGIKELSQSVYKPGKSCWETNNNFVLCAQTFA